MSFIVDAEHVFGSQWTWNGSQTELIFPCPDCHEHGKEWKLYVNAESGVYYCQRCNKTGYAKLSPRVRASAGQKREPVSLEEIFAQAVQPDTPAYKYLTDVRGLTPQQIVSYAICASPIPSWHGGVILPTLDETYRGFVVRIYDKSASWRWGKVVDRYYNSPGFRRVNTLYNFIRAKSSRYIKVCEGAFSVIAAGTDSIGTYGKDVALPQFERLVTLDPEEFIVCFDGDAKFRTWHLCMMLYSYGKRVTRIELPHDQDPDSVEDFSYYLKHRRPVDDLDLLFLKRDAVREQMVRNAYQVPNSTPPRKPVITSG